MSNSKTLLVAFVLCVVCSILVSTTAVKLKPKQDLNAVLDMKMNILMAAGLMKPGDDIEEKFKQVETAVIDFSSGKITTDIDADTYDQTKAAKNPDMNVKIPSDIDVGGLSTRAKYAKVYFTRNNGKVNLVILNVRGIGLWSTMHGFLALEGDTKTVRGFAYYSQGETPGLGGEIDNPNWKNQWVGKLVYDENWKPAFELAKGTVDNTHGLAQYRVDGLSGATITGNGVTTSIQYWLGSHGYGNFLKNIRNGEI